MNNYEYEEILASLANKIKPQEQGFYCAMFFGVLEIPSMTEQTALKISNYAIESDFFARYMAMLK